MRCSTTEWLHSGAPALLAVVGRDILENGTHDEPAQGGHESDGQLMIGHLKQQSDIYAD